MGIGLNKKDKLTKEQRIIKEALEKTGSIRHNSKGDAIITCCCGQEVFSDDITFIHPIDVNYFDWWSYELLDKENIDDSKWKTKIRLDDKYKPWCYIGYVPLLKEIPYYLHKWFHKPDYALDIDCKYCENDEDMEDKK